MQPTNEKELEWYINGVLSTCSIEHDNFTFCVIPIDNRFKVEFAKWQEKKVPSGVGDEMINEDEITSTEYFTWLKQESSSKLVDYIYDIVNWLNN